MPGAGTAADSRYTPAQPAKPGEYTPLTDGSSTASTVPSLGSRTTSMNSIGRTARGNSDSSIKDGASVARDPASGGKSSVPPSPEQHGRTLPTSSPSMIVRMPREPRKSLKPGLLPRTVNQGKRVGSLRPPKFVSSENVGCWQRFSDSCCWWYWWLNRRQKAAKNSCQWTVECYMQSAWYVATLIICTVISLLASDIGTLFFKPSADLPIQIILMSIFCLFLVDLVLLSWVKDRYFLSFFFLLDLIATLSIITEVPLIVGTDGVYEWTQQNTGARTTTRAARVVRLVRLIRLIRVIRVMHKSSLNEVSEVIHVRDSTLDHVVQSSKVETEIAHLTSKRVVCGVLIMLLVLPQLETISTTSPVWEGLRVVEEQYLHAVDLRSQAAGDIEVNQAVSSMMNSTVAAFVNTISEPVLMLRLGDIVVIPQGDTSHLRDLDIVTIDTDRSCVIVDSSDYNKQHALFSVLLTLFSMAILVGGTILLSHDLKQLVVRPLDKMALMVQKLTNTLYSMSEQQGLVERSEKESAQLMHEGDEDDDDEGYVDRVVATFDALITKQLTRHQTAQESMHGKRASVSVDVAEAADKILHTEAENPKYKPSDFPSLHSLETVIKCDVARHHFKMFLAAEWGVENLIFWQEVTRYRQILQTSEPIAKRLFDVFIADESPSQVNISSQQRGLIEKKMGLTYPFSTIFDEAQLEIYSLMNRDSFPRFLRSNMAQLLMDQLANPGKSSAESVQESISSRLAAERIITLAKKPIAGEVPQTQTTTTATTTTQAVSARGGGTSNRTGSTQTLASSSSCSSSSTTSPPTLASARGKPPVSPHGSRGGSMPAFSSSEKDKAGDKTDRQSSRQTERAPSPSPRPGTAGSSGNTVKAIGILAGEASPADSRALLLPSNAASSSSDSVISPSSLQRPHSSSPRPLTPTSRIILPRVSSASSSSSSHSSSSSSSSVSAVNAVSSTSIPLAEPSPRSGAPSPALVSQPDNAQNVVSIQPLRVSFKMAEPANSSNILSDQHQQQDHQTMRPEHSPNASLSLTEGNMNASALGAERGSGGGGGSVDGERRRSLNQLPPLPGACGSLRQDRLGRPMPRIPSFRQPKAIYLSRMPNTSASASTDRGLSVAEVRERKADSTGESANAHRDSHVVAVSIVDRHSDSMKRGSVAQESCAVKSDGNLRINTPNAGSERGSTAIPGLLSGGADACSVSVRTSSPKHKWADNDSDSLGPMKDAQPIKDS